MSTDEKTCNKGNCLIACTKEAFYYIICILYLLMFIFYIFRLFKAIAAAVKTSFKVMWAQLVFWISMTISPAIGFLYYLKFNIWGTNSLLYFIFGITRCFADVIPYIALSVVIMQLSGSINPSERQRKRQRRISWVLFGYLSLFIICLIIYLADASFWQQMSDIILIVVHVVTFIIFMCVSINMFKDFYDMSLTTLPPKFFKYLAIGLHFFAFFNFVYIIVNCFWWGYQDCSGYPFSVLVNHRRKIIIFLQFLSDVIGVMCPNLILAFGIIYLNAAPSQTSSISE